MSEEKPLPAIDSEFRAAWKILSQRFGICRICSGLFLEYEGLNKEGFCTRCAKDIDIKVEYAKELIENGVLKVPEEEK